MKVKVKKVCCRKGGGGGGQRVGSMEEVALWSYVVVGVYREREVATNI